MQALEAAIKLMESDPFLSLNSGKLQGLREDNLYKGLWWYLGPAERLTLHTERIVHIIYRDLQHKVQVSEGFHGYAPLRQVIPAHPLNELFKFHCFCLIAQAPTLLCPKPLRTVLSYVP